MEADLVATLKTLCPRVFPDFAAVETTMPYVTFQHIGGPALRNLDNSPMTHRHTAMQINIAKEQPLLDQRLATSIRQRLHA